MIELVEGSLVRHARFGIGQVRATSGEETTVAFRSGKQETVLPEELVPLSREGFWHLAYADPDAAARKLAAEPAQTISLLLRDLPNGEGRTAQIRTHLEQFVAGDWGAWWRQAKKMLKRDPTIDTSRSSDGLYALAERPRSFIMELYGRFQALPQMQQDAQHVGSLIPNPEKLAAARRILSAVASGESLAPPQQRKVQAFVTATITDASVPVAGRADILLRAGDLGWLSDDQIGAALGDLCRIPIRLYEIDAYAQNRIINAVLEHVGCEAGQDMLLSAFATAPPLLHQVSELYMARDQAETLVQGLWIGLIENLAGPRTDVAKLRRWYRSVEQRLGALGVVLHQIVFDAGLTVDWPTMATHLSGFIAHLSKLDPVEAVPKLTLRSFTGLWHRAMTLAPPNQRGLFLDIPLTIPLRSPIVSSLLGSVFREGAGSELATAFTARMSQSARSSLDPLCKCIVDDHWAWNSEVEALSYLLTNLAERQDIIHWASQRAIKAVERSQDSVFDFLPILDRLADLEHKAVTLERIDGLRQDAFERICAAVREGEDLKLPAIKFDSASLAGLQNFASSLSAKADAAHEAARDKIARAGESARTAERRLKQSEDSLKELRRAFRQPDAAVKFAERVRILRPLADTTAEFERFASLHERGRAELTGMVRRLNSLLGRMGAVPFGDIGDEVSFDASQHEYVGSGHGRSQVLTVIERGYTVRNLGGEQQMLRPAKVAPVEGNS